VSGGGRDRVVMPCVDTVIARCVHERSDRDVDPADRGGLGIDTGRVQPRQDRHGEPCRTQTHGLCGVCCAEPFCSGGYRSPCDCDGAVSVPICLTTAMIRERVRARAIAMFAVTASGIVCSVGGRRSTGLGWVMPSVLVTVASSGPGWGRHTCAGSHDRWLRGAVRNARVRCCRSGTTRARRRA
jgi:hypothetical protein